MDTMKALIIEKDGSYSVKVIPQPEINDYQVLVKMLATSVCGTDTKIMHGTFKLVKDYPLILGHEGVGEVVKVGAKVTGMKLGDHVICPYTFVKCGEYIGGGGAMAEYSIANDLEAIRRDGIEQEHVSDDALVQFVIPSDLDPVAATMIVTFREICLATKRMNWKPGESIVIYGAGPVGLTFVRFAKLMGLGPVVSIDLFDAKLAGARKQGADYVFNSTTCDIEAEIKKLFPEGPDIILDAAGVPALINQNLRMIKNMGRVYVYGVTPKNEADIDWSAAPYNFTLSFIQVPTKEEEHAAHEPVMQLIREGKIDGMDYISDVFDFDHILDAIDLFVSGKNEKKISIRF